MTKVLAIVLLLASTSSFAQKGVGLRAGISLSNYRDDADNSASSNVTGYTAALFYKIATASVIVFKPEISISAQGGGFRVNNVASTFKTMQVNAAAIISNEGGEKKIFFEGGLQLGKIISAKKEINSIKSTITDSLKTMDMAIVLGLGYKLGKNLVAAARYNYGLTDITKSKNDRMYNNALQITLAYSAFFRRKEK